MKKIIKLAVLIVAVFHASLTFAKPIVQFTSSTITVRQDAGAVSIPISITGPKDSANGLGPEVSYFTQDGTAKQYSDYEKSGRSEILYAYDNVSAVLNATIPVYFTGDTFDKFFTVILNNASYSNLGNPSAITVTILGYQPPPVPPAIVVSTSVVKQGNVSIKGYVSELADADIISVKVKVLGKTIKARGKTTWKANLFFPAKGRYRVNTFAYLTSGQTLSSSKVITVK